MPPPLTSAPLAPSPRLRRPPSSPPMQEPASFGRSAAPVGYSVGWFVRGGIGLIVVNVEDDDIAWHRPIARRPIAHLPSAPSVAGAAWTAGLRCHRQRPWRFPEALGPSVDAVAATGGTGLGLPLVGLLVPLFLVVAEPRTRCQHVVGWGERRSMRRVVVRIPMAT